MSSGVSEPVVEEAQSVVPAEKYFAETHTQVRKTAKREGGRKMKRQSAKSQRAHRAQRLYEVDARSEHPK